jgi:hypothetical protein
LKKAGKSLLALGGHVIEIDTMANCVDGGENAGSDGNNLKWE